MINQGALPPHLMQQGIQIFEEAFHNKFHSIAKEQHYAEKIYELLLSSEELFYIEESGVLLGVLLFSGYSSKSTVTLKKLIQLMGVYKGTMTLLKLSIFSHRVKPKEMHVDFVAVSSTARGKGVGTQLIQHAIAYASMNHLTSLFLEVIDTNPRAKKLYESLGFETVRAFDIHPVDKLYKWDFKALNIMYYFIK